MLKSFGSSAVDVNDIAAVVVGTELALVYLKSLAATGGSGNSVKIPIKDAQELLKWISDEYDRKVKSGQA